MNRSINKEQGQLEWPCSLRRRVYDFCDYNIVSRTVMEVQTGKTRRRVTCQVRAVKENVST